MRARIQIKCLNLRAKSDEDAARCIRPSYQLPIDSAILFYVPFVAEYLVGERVLALLDTVIIPNHAPGLDDIFPETLD
jgi:hypothetical protein